MKWRIPAKTFLVGEYAAVAGAGAILLTTSPCFEMTLVSGGELSGIHPQSPAGRWWATQAAQSGYGLVWRDPYAGRGGLGASSAQFLGAWLASCHVSGVEPTQAGLLDAYHQSAWAGQGLKPSGYDVLAQSSRQCVYVNRQQDEIRSYAWPFSDLSFLLLHSGHKLATHHHLQTATLPPTDNLSRLVEQARHAFEDADSERLVQVVQAYQEALRTLGLTAEHTLKQLQVLSDPAILAAKGCGALGADVLLLLIPTTELDHQANRLTKAGWTILASNNDLYGEQPQTLSMKKSLEKA